MTEEPEPPAAAPAGTPAAPPARRRLTRRFLLAGIATLLPLFLTGYIVYACYNFVHTNLGGWLAWLLAKGLDEVRPDGRIGNPAVIIAGDILAVVIVLGIGIIVGALTASFFGRQIIRFGEHFLLKLPIVRVIYPYVKQVTDFFLGERKMEFGSVVIVPYPRVGVYSFGFVTGPSMRSVSQAAGEEMMRVFIPSSPTPFMGYVVFIPRREIVPVPITVEEAVALLVSGGVIAPDRELGPVPPPRKGLREGPAWADKP